jgi:O-antigen ligase
LIRHWHLKENEIFTPLKAGFCLSFLLALVQKLVDPDFLAQSWWRLKLNQVNGGFSDFNAFGFFSGAMFLYQALRLTDKLPWRNEIATHDKAESSDGILRSLGFKTLLPEILFLMTTLAAIFISGCRAAFLFVLLAVIYLIFSRKTSYLIKALIVLLLAVSLLVAGGTFKRRLQQSFAQTAHISGVTDLSAAADAVSSGRLAMLKNSVRMIARFPVSGVGAGNFLFYLKYLHFNETFYEDLPLNQYLLIASETGLAGSLIFIFFMAVCWKRCKPGIMRFVILAIAMVLLFNNFFWFPECLLLFWIFLAGSDYWDAAERKSGFTWILVIVFIVFNVADFPALHPKSLIRQKGGVYDYGFWPSEKNERGTFSWTRRAAGKYFAVDAARDFALFCGAPQLFLQKKGMDVLLFWRGQFFRKVHFVDNRFEKLRLPKGQAGFLEFRVHPTFNMQAMNLGADARELGVQFMELTKPLR